MHSQELSIEVPSQGARRATGEGSKSGWQQPQRFSARQKTEVVLRLLRGEALDLLSRELGIPAARITTWREAFLDAGQEALKKHPLDSRDRALTRLHQKLGEATMEIALLAFPVKTRNFVRWGHPRTLDEMSTLINLCF